MAVEQAADFASVWAVVDQYNDTSGISATVFQEIASGTKYLAIRGTQPTDVGDLTADYILAQGFPSFLNQQFIQLSSVISNWLSSGVLSSNFTVTGHSLGGYLASAVGSTFHVHSSHVYTYNAPGLAGISGNLFDAFRAVFGLDNAALMSDITNVRGTAGISLITGLGLQLAPPLMIETELTTNPLGVFDNHSIVNLTDSLAVQNVLATLDPSVSTDTLNGLIKSSGRVEKEEQENTIDAIRRYLGEAVATPVGDHETFWTNLLDLQSTTGFKNLIGKVSVEGPGASANDARADFGKFLSLVCLTPFALKPLDIAANILLQTASLKNTELALQWEQDNSLTLEQRASGQGHYSDMWLNDRAQMLSHLLQRNHDDTLFASSIPIDQVFEDYALPGVLDGTHLILTGPETLGENSRQIIFGDDNANLNITGGDKNDDLYGGAGDDLITGGEGNDYLEGGQGNDVYVFAAGDGMDTILDTDGQGQITLDGKQLKGQTGISETSWIQAGNTWQDRRNHIGYDLITHIDGTKDLIIATELNRLALKNWSDGELGITLGTATNTEPAIDLCLTGDLSPVDQDPNADGIQLGYDALGNVIVGTEVEPDRTDTLYDDTGNDRLQGLGGADILDASRGGDDILEGGAGSDVLSGGSGNDQLFGELQKTLAQAQAEGETQLTTGLRGDWLNGGIGTDQIIGEGGNDLILGGGDEDVIYGGSGDDNIYGDAGGSANRDWAMTRIQSTNNNTVIYTADFSNANVTDSAQGAADILYGGAGNDWIYGNQGNDIIDAGVGDDIVFGGAGQDIILGFAGNDTLIGNTSIDSPQGDSSDYIDGGQGDDVLLGGGGADMLMGGLGNDELTGDGNGTPSGEEGDDTLDGGEGNDQLSGNGGNDTLLGGTGTDLLHGNDGNDILDGGDGDDLSAINGNTLGDGGLDGGAGDDIIYGGAGQDELLGGDGFDILDGGSGDDLLFGQIGNDNLDGGAGADYLAGGAGDDLYINVTGEDTINDTEGHNTIRIANAAGVGASGVAVNHFGDQNQYLGVSIALDSGETLNIQDAFYGTDAIIEFANDDTLDLESLVGTSLTTALALGLGDNGGKLYGGAGADTLSGGSGDDSLSGALGVDKLYGRTGKDILNGGNGADILDGGEGEDTLIGGAGRDLLLGGIGNDEYRLGADAGGDLITDSQGQNLIRFGGDIVPANLNATVSALGNQTALILKLASVELATITQGFGNYCFEFTDGKRLTADEFLLDFGTGNGNVYGSNGDDSLFGSQAAESLYGQDGNDTLWGGRGADVLNGGLGSDDYRYRLGDGLDTIQEFDNPDSGQGSQDRVTFGTGITLSDIVFNRRPNGDLSVTVAGLTDAITVSGWYTDPANRVESFVFADGQTVTTQTLAELDITPLEGTAENDTLNGTNYNDIIMAGSGDDLLIGNSGSDQLHGEAGTDSYRLSLGGGTDQVFEVAGETSVIDVTGYDLSRLVGTQVGDDLLLSVTSAGDSLTLKSYYTMDHDWLVKNQANAPRQLANVLAENDAYRASRSEVDRLEDGFIANTQDRVFEKYKMNGMVPQTDGTWWTPFQITLSHQAETYVRTPGYSGYVPSDSSNYYLDTSNLTVGEFSVSNYSSDAAEISHNSMTSNGGSSSAIPMNVHVEWLAPTTVSSSRVVSELTGHYLYSYEEAIALSESLDAGAAVDPWFLNPYVYTWTPAYTRTATTNGQVATALSVTSADGSGYNIFGANPKNLFELSNLPDTLSVTANNADVGIDVVTAGDSDNSITLSGGFGIVHAGGGNDKITAAVGPWSYIGSQVVMNNMLLDGGSGDDLVIGSINNDTMIGGSGNDVLVGGSGNDRYYFMLGDTGVDLIFDTGYTGYNMDEFGNLIDSDIVVFGEGISLSSFSASWGSEALHNDGGNRLYQTLDVSWKPDSIIRIAMPREDEYAWEKTGIEFFEFADGSRMTMAQMLALAGPSPEHAPLIVTPLTDQIATEDIPFSYTIPADVFVDLDAKDVLTYSQNVWLNWLNFDTNTRTFSGTPDANAIYPTDITVTATDRFGASISDTFTLMVKPINKLTGSNGNDSLLGTAGADKLEGLAGSDILDGKAEGDKLIGGQGDDILYGGDGNDWLYGGEFEESIPASVVNHSLIHAKASSLNDTLLFNLDDNDWLDGGSGADIMFGGLGNDTYIVDSTGDNVIENADAGFDTVQSSIDYDLNNAADVENLTLTGRALNATGNALGNILTGSNGDNRLDGGLGIDRLAGGLGSDLYIVDNSGDVIVENCNAGYDMVWSSASYTLEANLEFLMLTGVANVNGVGNELDNYLIGTAGNNRLSGGGGLDSLDGGSGVDIMLGGMGDDYYYVDNINDIAFENAGEGGSDTVHTRIDNYKLGDNVEMLVLLDDSEAITGTGNAGDNWLYGNRNDNVLIGLAGNDVLDAEYGGRDTLVGGLGDDTYWINALDGLADTIIENADEGIDTVYVWAQSSYTLDANVENGISGDIGVCLTGNALDNLLEGDDGENLLSGEAGNDTLTGHGGNDTYILGRGYGADTVVETDATAGNSDVAQFMTGVNANQLWFSHTGNNLEVDIIGTADKLLIKDWYSGSANHIEQFRTTCDLTLLDTQVENLVSAMAAFAPPAAGQTVLPQNYQDALAPVLAANWH